MFYLLKQSINVRLVFWSAFIPKNNYLDYSDLLCESHINDSLKRRRVEHCHSLMNSHECAKER